MCRISREQGRYLKKKKTWRFRSFYNQACQLPAKKTSVPRSLFHLKETRGMEDGGKKELARGLGAGRSYGGRDLQHAPSATEDWTAMWGMGGEGAALLGEETAQAAPPQLGLGSRGGDGAARAGSSGSPGRSRGAARFEEDSDAEKIVRSQGSYGTAHTPATKKQVDPHAAKGRAAGASAERVTTTQLVKSSSWSS
jgi:hypothetical protein